MPHRSQSARDLAPTANQALAVWLVNQYALRETQPGITRHATLARLMAGQKNYCTTIFASGTHYWNLTDRPLHESTESTTFWPQFIHINTAPVISNGFSRVLSMLGFSGRVLLKARTPKAAGAPRPDIVLGSSPHPFAALAAWLLAKRYRVPFVLEVRDLWPKSLIELMGLRRRHPLVRFLERLERFLYERADIIITLLPGSERHIRQAAPDASRVVWIPNGLDVSALPPVTPPPEQPEFVVMYAGAHGVPNSLDTLLEAASILQRDPRASHIKFVLVGDGKEKSNLRAMAETLGLTRVEFREAVEKSEVPEVLATANLLAITWRDTPLYQDGISPNKLFDYMASGRPVIMAVDTPVNPLHQARAGMTVAPEDPMALAAGILHLSQTRQEMLAEMGARGRAYVETHHDMNALAVQYASAIASARFRGNMHTTLLNGE